MSPYLLGLLDDGIMGLQVLTSSYRQRDTATRSASTRNSRSASRRWMSSEQRRAERGVTRSGKPRVVWMGVYRLEWNDIDTSATVGGLVSEGWVRFDPTVTGNYTPSHGAGWRVP